MDYCYNMVQMSLKEFKSSLLKKYHFSYVEWNALMSAALKHGKEGHIEAILMHPKPSYMSTIVQDAYIEAIRTNNVKGYKMLLKVQPFYSEGIFEMSVFSSKRICKLAYREGYTSSERVLLEAFLYAPKSVFNFLVKKGVDFSVLYNDKSKVNQKICECFKYCIHMSDERFSELIDDGYIRDEKIIEAIIDYGSIEKVKILYQKGLPFPDTFFRIGCGKVVDFLHEKGLCQYSKPCSPNCKKCAHFRTDALSKLWEMTGTRYRNVIQWLPNETLEDLIELIY